MECRSRKAPLEASHTGLCPECGREAGKTIRVTVSCKVAVSEWTEARGIEQGKGRSTYFQRVQQGKELFRKTGRVHQVTRNIDRRDGRYYEHIEDAETGEVIRHKNEPLKDPTRLLPTLRILLNPRVLSGGTEHGTTVAL